jgi:hypothetical protein
MSTLKVGQIQDLTGKPLVKPTGSVLQVVTYNDTSITGEITTTSASPVTSGLSVSMTPYSSTSKLFVLVTANIHFRSGSGDDGVALQLRRDGVGVRTAGVDSLFYRSDSNANVHYTQAAFQHLVNANSTNPTTFTLFFYDAWGGTASIHRDWSSPALTVMEIAA